MVIVQLALPSRTVARLIARLGLIGTGLVIAGGFRVNDASCLVVGLVLLGVRWCDFRATLLALLVLLHSHALML